MPFAKFWCEQTASNVWIAEVEVGFPISRFEAMRAETYDDIMAKVDESYRRLTGPSEKEKRKALEAQNPHLPEGVANFFGMAPEPAAEPADAPDALEAPEAAETATDHQAASVERPALAVNMTAPNAYAAYEGAQDAMTTAAQYAEPPVRQKRQYRKRAKAV